MFELKTDHPVALDSRDHAVVGGAMMDFSTNVDFLKRCRGFFHPVRSVALLDLGCSTGAFVYDAHKEGFFACGLEGTDYCLARGHGRWGDIPGNLFCCDVTRPFTLGESSVREKTGLVLPFRFDVVTSWEVMEHLPEDRLGTVVQNVLAHLMPDGIWAMSVSKQEGYHHRTVRPKWWWDHLFGEHGLKEDGGAVAHFGDTFVRGLNEPDSWVTVLRRKQYDPGKVWVE